MTSGDSAGGAARAAGDKIEQVGGKAQRSGVYRGLVTVGLIAYGVVHLLIAWIAGQLAWGRTNEKASQQGALEELASKPFGGVLLWVVAVGLFALVVWQLVEATVGHRDKQGKDRVGKQLSSLGRAAVYLAIGVSAAMMATGSSSGGNEKSATARLMAAPFGRILVAGVGLVILAIGVRHLYKAATAKFTDDLTSGVGSGTIVLGRVGYAAKGVALGIVGALFGWAALAHDSRKAGGLDPALRMLRDQPYGRVLLTMTALGIAAFGVYCFVWSRNAKH
ncbi:DUF1206 domain-containing protein [Kribbella sp. NBC_01245]|uniref:DUF1206 domain-containing protein n=1 Tax=Kribbella sp. NBC_01245 TaxID=2903578 RepID=UPI002E2E29F7|nr:DUF1206 domain-containing protein [Kribbella sp. NBC_01245]